MKNTLINEQQGGIADRNRITDFKPIPATSIFLEKPDANYFNLVRVCIIRCISKNRDENLCFHSWCISAFLACLLIGYIN